MKKLRLLVTKECHRHCKGCCNKQWDLDKLPVCTSYEGYDEIMITGGEPLLVPRLVETTVYDIRSKNYDAKIILYTADPFLLTCMVMEGKIGVSGITLTLHRKLDAEVFRMFETNIDLVNSKDVSLRLNVFKGIKIPTLSNHWKVKDNITWIKNCPLPEDETFMRL